MAMSEEAHPEISNVYRNIECEMALLGSMLLSPKVAAPLCESMNIGDFWVPAHQCIFRAMKVLESQGSAIDFVTVRSELVSRGELKDIGGENYLLEVADYVPSPSNAQHYAAVVLECSTRRAYQREAAAFAKLTADPDLSIDILRIKAEAIVNARTRAKDLSIHLGDVPEDEAKAEGVSTGFAVLDVAISTRGYPKGQMTIIRADHKGGKTMFMLSSAVHAARNASRVLYATFADLNKAQLKSRIMRNLTGWSRRPMTEPNISTYEESREEISREWEFRVYDAASMESGSDVETFCAWLRAEHDRKPIDYVFVDYAQELRSCDRRITNEVGEQNMIAHKMSRLAAQTGLPIIVGSQVTRGREGEKTKTKYSRAWEEKAGWVLTIDRDETVVGIEISYSRFGRQGVTVNLRFNESNLRFEEVK